jgi:cell wall-associated NlpC family hydrolase
MLKIAGIVLGVITLLIVLIGGAVEGVLRAFVSSGASQPSTNALTDIPPDYLTLYRKAAQTCPGLDWAILAAIGKIETNHGRSRLPGVHKGENTAGAGGPMQFLQNTFNRVVSRHPTLPGDATTPPSRYNPHDAIYTAAAYLCDSGARNGRDLHSAIFAYNHAEWYVSQVLAQAEQYHSTPAAGANPAPSAAALQAINYAHGQLGLPYVWGGNGAELTELPSGQTQVRGGFDCSGLTKAAYAAAGMEIPRTAQMQYNAGPRVPPGQPLLPGDLVFFGASPSVVTHVGIAISATEMINAPHHGAVVRIERIWRSNFLGATRPAGSPGG